MALSDRSMATSSPAIWVFFLISPLLIIKEIISSRIGYAILVTSCILYFLYNLCILRNSRSKRRDSVVWNFSSQECLEKISSRIGYAILVTSCILIKVTSCILIQVTSCILHFLYNLCILSNSRSKRRDSVVWNFSSQECIEKISSRIGYAILVNSCILHYLYHLCILRNSRSKQRDSVVWNFSIQECLEEEQILDLLFLAVIGEDAKSRPGKLCAGANVVSVPYLQKIEEIIQASIGYAAQVRSYTLQFLCLFCILAEDLAIRRAPKHHPRAARQHDLWSHGWHIMALLIRSLTSQVFGADFCPVKEVGSWMLIDRASGVVIAEKVLISSLSSSAPRVLYKGSVERKNYSRSRPANSQELELVKIVDKLWAHISNGQKAYKKSRTTHPGKHGHNVGSTAFRNWAQGGGGSGGERTIQDDWRSTNTTVNRSVQMTSPPAKTTPQTPPPPPQTPPSPTRRAPPQVQPPATTPPVQTPAAAPPPPPPPPPGPPRAVGWFNFNVAGLAEIFLGISLTIVLAPPQILHSGGNSLSASDRKLLFGSQLFGFAGFILCLLAYIVQGNRAAKLLIAFGVVANIFGLLLIVALGR